MSVVEYDYETFPDSSAIERVVYDNKSHSLFVEFPNGNLAGYAGVDPDDVYALVESNSVGRHYAREIKGQYKGINTDGVTFKKRGVPNPGAATPRTPHYEGVDRPKFLVTYKTTVTVEVPAKDLASAVVQVLNGNPGATITEVKEA